MLQFRIKYTLASVAFENGIDGWAVFIGKWRDFKFYLLIKVLVFQKLTWVNNFVLINQLFILIFILKVIVSVLVILVTT
jgi:hypothetical protein